MNIGKTYYISVNGIIAAFYVVVTLLCNGFGLSNNLIQVRISEALTILPHFSGWFIPGITIGCLISNIMTGALLPDVIFGTLATLIGGIGTYLLRKRSSILAPVPPIAANSIVLPIVFKYAYGISNFWLSVVTVGIGELISCGLLGMLLLNALKKRKIVIIQR